MNIFKRLIGFIFGGIMGFMLSFFIVGSYRKVSFSVSEIPLEMWIITGVIAIFGAIYPKIVLRGFNGLFPY